MLRAHGKAYTGTGGGRAPNPSEAGAFLLLAGTAAAGWLLPHTAPPVGSPPATRSTRPTTPKPTDRHRCSLARFRPGRTGGLQISSPAPRGLTDPHGVVLRRAAQAAGAARRGRRGCRRRRRRAAADARRVGRLAPGLLRRRGAPPLRLAGAGQVLCTFGWGRGGESGVTPGSD